MIAGEGDVKCSNTEFAACIATGGDGAKCGTDAKDPYNTCITAGGDGGKCGTNADDPYNKCITAEYGEKCSNDYFYTCLSSGGDGGKCGTNSGSHYNKCVESGGDPKKCETKGDSNYNLCIANGGLGDKCSSGGDSLYNLCVRYGGDGEKCDKRGYRNCVLSAQGPSDCAEQYGDDGVTRTSCSNYAADNNTTVENAYMVSELQAAYIEASDPGEKQRIFESLNCYYGALRINISNCAMGDVACQKKETLPMLEENGYKKEEAKMPSEHHESDPTEEIQTADCEPGTAGCE